jgi:hypothetical protein
MQKRGGSNMKTYLVTYTATYNVISDSEDNAVDEAIQAHSIHPDGTWEAEIDHYNSDNYDTLGVK